MRDYRDYAIVKSLYCAKERLLRQVEPAGRDSLRHLTALKDAYSGKRCWIIGNGPSLRQTDLTRLRGEFTFGLNRIYLLFPELGFGTTFLVAINRLVLEQVGAELLDFPGPLFLPWSARKQLVDARRANLRYVLTSCPSEAFSRDARAAMWTGATVTYIALQLAFHMGFAQVILVGVDHSFSTQGPAHMEITSTGEDPNHFSPDYFGKGFRWQLPDLETSEKAYQLAKAAFKDAGREVLDATVGGKLQVFPKVDYNGLF